MGSRVVRPKLRPVYSTGRFTVRVAQAVGPDTDAACGPTPRTYTPRPAPGAIAADAVTSDRHGSEYRFDSRSRRTTRRRDALASLPLLGWSIRISVVRERGPICGNSFGTRRYLFSAAIDVSPTPAR